MSFLKMMETVQGIALAALETKPLQTPATREQDNANVSTITWFKRVIYKCESKACNSWSMISI